MPRTIVEWEWEEAFSKYGFDDGAGWNGTSLVCFAIDELGYNTVPECWGSHNYQIIDIEKDGKSILFEDARHFSWNDETIARMEKNGVTNISEQYIGYTDPNLFLPDDILERLNATFTDDYEVAG